MRLGAASKFLAMLCMCWMHAQVYAQFVPRPYSAGETRGTIVDEATGQPVEGAVVVARWDWLDFHQTLESHGYYFNGDAVHVGEDQSDRAGRFLIPGWGPAVRSGGKVDDSAPNLIVFKSGYEPLERRVPAEGAIRLKKSARAPKDHAEAILRVQGGRREELYGSSGHGLAWLHDNQNWKSMPRMILALHREKLLLGEDGAKILGAHMLYGRAGKGVVVDAQTQQTIRGGIVSIAWAMRRGDGSAGTLRVVQTKRAASAGSDSQFYVSPWRLPGPDVPGWEIATDAAPLVRLYAPGYRHSAEVRWEEKGGIVSLEKLPQDRNSLLAELREWRRDADRALASGDREAALALQWPLLGLLIDQCRGITPDLREGLCYPEGSEVARYVQKTMSAGYMIDHEDGARMMRIVVVGAGTAHVATQAAGASPRGAADQKPNVRGFSIEPVQ